jgi:hypothetical protein
MISGTPIQLELHRLGITDDADAVLQRLAILGNTKYAIITKEYFVNRRSAKALSQRHNCSLSTIWNMIRMGINNLNEREFKNEHI